MYVLYLIHVPNLHATTILTVSLNKIVIVCSGLTVRCSKAYISGSNWDVRKILSDSEI